MSMKLSAAMRALTMLIKQQRPTILWGPPGIGKTQGVEQVGEALKMEVKIVVTALLDPVDLRGVPSVRDGVTYWNAPCFLPTKGEGILFLDELGHAEKGVQAACLHLLQGRKLGEYTLPDGWTVVAATNRSEDRAGCGKFISPLNNRFVHLDVEVDKDDWRSWAVAKGIASEVRTFIDFQPHLLHAHDPKLNERAFPTPRSWEYVSQILPNLTDELLLPVLEGTVGKAAAAHLTAFLRLRHGLPKLADILANPKGHPISDDNGLNYALVGMLTDAIKSTSESETVSLITFMERMPSEFSVLLVRDWLVIKPKLVQHKNLQGWIMRNRDVIQGKAS